MKQERQVTIYALCDPTTNEVRYIGRTIYTPESRLYSHMHMRAGLDRNPRQQWLQELKENNQQPTIRILEVTTASNARAIESKWILHGIQEGWNLTNVNYNPNVYPTYWKNQTRRILTHDDDGLPQPATRPTGD